MPDPTPDQQFAAEQAAEYSTFVATKPIYVGTARAFNTGDPVPVSHVERGVVSEDAVAKVTTKAGKAAVEQSPTTTVKEG